MFGRGGYRGNVTRATGLGVVGVITAVAFVAWEKQTRDTRAEALFVRSRRRRRRICFIFFNVLSPLTRRSPPTTIRPGEPIAYCRDKTCNARQCSHTHRTRSRSPRRRGRGGGIINYDPTSRPGM